MSKKTGCLGILLAFLRGENSYTPAIRYSRRQFLSPAERSFLGVLDLAVNGDYRIFTKVRMADILQSAGSKAEKQSLFNRISAKHVDFVICRSDTMSVSLVIELDDSSQAIATDAFKNQALASAGIPLIRFPARRSYAIGEVQMRVFEAMTVHSTMPPLPIIG